MDTKKKLSLAAAGVAAIVCVIALSHLFLPSGPDVASPGRGLPGNERIPLVENDPFIDHMVNEFRKYYGKTIGEKATQAGIISIRDFVMSSRPANGRSVFYTILKRAFPDRADEIMDTLARLDEYNRWLGDNKYMLMRLSASERSAALWKKRRELFGDDADKIWSGDMLATEARKAQMQDTLAALSENDGTSIEDKFQVYESALRATYKDSPEAFILEQPELLSKVFFSIDSVQDELKAMSPEARQQAISDIRRQMGSSEEQVERMAARDADNERRWQVGYQYMEKRDEAVKLYQGAELEERLDALRQQYFGNEANTIALEEKDNFFRFKRPRIYGRN
ncbi:MAG TPA: hypothetical protein PKM41_02430 [Deltaproteobacteria bacterium]|jgi:hypothetical protein|nr:hypothetical protein [Deltaproteobacteria bacterium]HOI05609.1 hypothetical protein [Deltaproteobacteria bacterium]